MAELIKRIQTNQGPLQIDYNGLANLPTLSNPNLLINSDFRNPVNQRDKKSYSGGDNRVYTIDRWCMGDNDHGRSVEVVSGGVRITNTNTQYVGTFHQVLEFTLPKDVYTATVKVKEISSGYATLQCNGTKASTQITLQVGVNSLTLEDATIDAFVIYLAPNSSITLEWAKLEQGSVFTNFVPRLIGEEIALCRRFFRKYGSYMLFHQFYENQYYGFYFDTPMRAKPFVSNFVALSTVEDNVSVGSEVEVDENCVRRIFSTNEYKSTAIMLESLELDAEIY